MADGAADHAEDAGDGFEEDEASEPALGGHFEEDGLFFAVWKLGIVRTGAMRIIEAR